MQCAPTTASPNPPPVTYFPPAPPPEAQLLCSFFSPVLLLSLPPPRSTSFSLDAQSLAVALCIPSPGPWCCSPLCCRALPQGCPQCPPEPVRRRPCPQVCFCFLPPPPPAHPLPVPLRLFHPCCVILSPCFPLLLLSPLASLLGLSLVSRRSLLHRSPTD